MPNQPPRSSTELIAAIATPPGKGGIGIIRLSGSGLEQLSKSLLDRPAQVGKVCHRNFLAQDGEPIDSGLALRFATPRSYTGEDVLELHGHGGTAIQQRLLERCFELGARLAEPGEFTLRAYTNGKLDLAQAEAVADLINATTERAARLAGASLRGALSHQANTIAAQLTEIRSHLEASIDFADEDIDPAGQQQINDQLIQLHQQVTQLHAACERSTHWQGVATVALVGTPNAGKSSLLNALSGTDAAIVDAEPGTTRDIVSASCEIAGLEVRLLDTAGLRDGGEQVEREGMRRARQAAEDADVVIAVHELPAQHTHPTGDLIVHNKIDLTNNPAPRRTANEVWLSATSGAGIDLLRELLAERCGVAGEEPPFLARTRHVNALAQALGALAEARTAPLPEQQAEYLREAHAQVGRITGQVSADELLGEIFARFCVGK